MVWQKVFIPCFHENKVFNSSTHVVNVLWQSVGHGHGLHEEPVVLVGGLGEAHLVGLLGDGLPVGHDGVGLLQGDLGVVLLEILKKRFSLKITLSYTGKKLFAFHCAGCAAFTTFQENLHFPISSTKSGVSLRTKSHFKKTEKNILHKMKR